VAQSGIADMVLSNLLPVTKEIADYWGRITIQAKRQGRTLATTDGLIAATAIEHNLTLVTRNTKDFADLDILLFNPWDPET